MPRSILLANDLFLEFRIGMKLTCWLDVKMADKSVAAMEEGVKYCDAFLCILSEDYFERPYCVKEMEWAIKYKDMHGVVPTATRSRGTCLGHGRGYR